MPTVSRTLWHLEQLVIRAATDTAFREALIASPADAAQTFACMQLSPDDVRLIQAIGNDLQRFGSCQRFHPEDVRIWAVGVLLLASFRAELTDWSLRFKSIQRNPGPLEILDVTTIAVAP